MNLLLTGQAREILGGLTVSVRSNYSDFKLYLGRYLTPQASEEWKRLQFQMSEAVR